MEEVYNEDDFDPFSTGFHKSGPLLSDDPNDKIIIDYRKGTYDFHKNASESFCHIILKLHYIIFNYDEINFNQKFELFCAFVNLNIIPRDLNQLLNLDREAINERIEINYLRYKRIFTIKNWNYIVNQLKNIFNN